MADANPPIIGNAQALERAAKEVLARAEAALRQAVESAQAMKGVATELEATATATGGEERAAQVINEKAAAAERAAAAVRAQNEAMREAAAASVGEAEAAAVIERKAAAAERATAALLAQAAAAREAYGAGAAAGAASTVTLTEGQTRRVAETQARLDAQTAAQRQRTELETQRLTQRTAELQTQADARSAAARERAEAEKESAAARSAAAREVSEARVAEAEDRAAASSAAAWDRAEATKAAAAARSASAREAAEARAGAAAEAAASRAVAAQESADARAAASARATVVRTDEKLRFTEQAPLARQRGATAAADLRAQQQLEAQVARNEGSVARGYRMVATGATEAADAQRASAVMMAENAAAAQGLSARLLDSAKKFGVFTVATAGLFGAIGLGRDVFAGAQQGQIGVQNLRRVMENVNPQQAMQGFSDLSRQTNVPINEAADATQRFARTFQNLPDSLSAARLALGFTKLDAIGLADSVRYLQSAAQAFHIGGGDLEARVADPLARLTQRAGVQPAQLMRALQASPSVATAGGNVRDFLAIAAAQLRLGATTGNQVSTATIRAITNFLPDPRNQATIRGLGLDPGEATTNYTRFLQQAIERSKDLTEKQRIDLARAIGGRQLGGRLFLPLFNRPETALRNLGIAQDSRGAFGEEMHAQLGRVDEQVKAVSNSLQRLGIQLAQSGIVTPFLVLARALGIVVDELGKVLQIVNTLTGPLHGMVGSIAALAGAGYAARRFDFGGRLARQTSATGLVGRFVPEDTRNRVVQQRATEMERERVDRELGNARAQQFTAATSYQTQNIAMQTVLAEPAATGTAARRAQEARQAAAVEAQEAAYTRFDAAQQRVLALEEQQARLAGEEVVATEALAAAKARTIVAQASANGATAEAAGASAAPGMFWRESNARVDVGAAEEVAAKEARGGRLSALLAGARGAPGALLGGLRGFGAAAATYGLPLLGIQELSGFTSTQGNALERLAGGGRSVLGTFGIHTGPITGAENRAAGARDARNFVAGLQGGASPEAQNEALMNARRRAITAQINVLDASSGGDSRRVAAQINRLYGELDRETRAEQAAVAQARAKRTGNTGGLLHSMLGLNSKQLDASISGALLPMTSVGDASGLDTAIAAVTAYSVQGHRQKRADLLQKSDQGARNIVSAIQSEMTDDLALANSQKERDAAYDKAATDALKLIAGGTPAERRQGRIALQQAADAQFQDYAQRSDALQGRFASTHRGDDAAVAQRAERAAANQYQRARTTYSPGDPKRAQAFQKYLDAKNAADDAALTDIERDTATRQAQARTAAGADRVLVNGLTRELARARSAAHPDAGRIAQITQQLTQANQQLAQQVLQDANTRTDALYGYLEAQTEDPYQQALLQRQAVYQRRYDPRDPNSGIERARDRAQADQQVRQAAHQQAINNIDAHQQLIDATTDPGNSVALAEHAAAAARRTYQAGGFATAADRTNALANMRKTAADTVRARQQAAYDDIQHQANTGKLTTDMEVAALRRMLSTVHNNKQLRSQIEEQIYSLTHQDSGALELQLGNIRLPSAYEVNRALREGGRAGGRNMQVVNHNSVTVNGGNPADVAGAIDGILGTSTRSALRAAGSL